MNAGRHRPHRDLLACALALAAGVVAAVDQGGPPAHVADYLARHCLSCHGADARKGDLDLHALPSDPANAALLLRIVGQRVLDGSMPPADEDRPTRADDARLLGWIAERIQAVGGMPLEAPRPRTGNAISNRELFAAAGRPNAGGSPSRLWRVTPEIYAARSKRLAPVLDVPTPFAVLDVPAFGAVAAAAAIDATSVELLLRNAGDIVDAQMAEEPALKALASASAPPAQPVVEAALRRQHQLVLGREPESAELARLLALHARCVRDAGPAAGGRAALQAILMLPGALYRSERGTGTGALRPLAPEELATALAYALGDAPPDAGLLAAARTGALSGADDVRREARRRLDDPAFAKPQLLRFFDVWFGFAGVVDVFKDVPAPHRKAWLPDALDDDTRQLIALILAEDRDVLAQLLTTTRSFVNSRVDPQLKRSFPARNAPVHRWYDLPDGWKWTAKQPIELGRGRAGVLTQPSWLAAYATNDATHPIHRGRWVRERLLGGIVPELPISVDARLPDRPGMTMRERLVEATRAEPCWRCHRLMDPLGLAFEDFDHLGRHRTSEQGRPVDAGGRIDGTGEPGVDGPVAGGAELARRLASSEHVRRVFVRHVFRYWMGREETIADARAIADMDRAYLASDGSFRALLVELLSSDAFLHRSDPRSEAP